MRGRNYYNDYIQFQSLQLPLRIYLEYRSGARYALGKNSFIFRIPVQIAESKRQELIIHGKNWALKILSGDPSLIKQFQTKPYRHGELIKCFDREWKICLINSNNGLVRTKWAENKLEIDVSEPTSEIRDEQLSKAVQKVLSSFYRPFLQNRTLELAQKHQFPKPQKVSLRYMSTRWGSCRKSTGTISINTKLLLAPEEVLDSVIVHELSHLIHPNHSLSFWKLVKQCDPDYKKYNKWLKTHGNQLML